MFKSLDCQSSQEVIILDPHWNKETIVPLRSKGREGYLVCPVCKQPVHVRAGERNRWHFAHNIISNCPLKHESANLLQARGLLYTWLRSKYGGKVTVEKHFPDLNLPRSLDCYVEISDEQKLGYWILDKGIRSRYPLQYAFSNLDISIVWVLLSSMLKIDDESPESVHLSPTERDFIYPSEYNPIYSHYDSALNYLDIEDTSVTTLRGLNCTHFPQKFSFDAALKDDLRNMLISPKTGEFVHPGEHERLLELQERLRFEEEQQRQNEIKEHRERELTKQRYLESLAARSPLPKTNYTPHVQTPNNAFTENTGNKQYPCSVCGILTGNWVIFDGKTDTCVCTRDCLRTQQKNRQFS